MTGAEWITFAVLVLFVAGWEVRNRWVHHRQSIADERKLEEKREEFHQRELALSKQLQDSQRESLERAHAREVEFKREIERAKETERARNPWLVRCGGDNWAPNQAGIPEAMWCGRIAPEWFVHDGQCEFCASGRQTRYPERHETETEYRAYLEAREEEHNALVSEYEQLAADFAKPDGNAARVVPVSEGGKLRVEQENASDADAEQEAEKEAGAKEGRRH